MLSNTLRALTDLSDKLDSQQKQQLTQKLAPLADHYSQPQLRVEAQELLTRLQG